eukprot:9064219-Pyramimonas_sp.AAC.1
MSRAGSVDVKGRTWMLRAIMWTLRAIVWMLRASTLTTCETIRPFCFEGRGVGGTELCRSYVTSVPGLFEGLVSA